MIVCQIAKKNIGFIPASKIFMENRLSKYVVFEEPFFICKSTIVPEIIVPSEEYLFTKTEFYDMYKCGEDYVQIQKYLGKIIGRIDYNLKSTNISILKGESIDDLEYLLTEYVIVYFLANTEQVTLMHGSSLFYKKGAIIFSAKSGTGKSTHTKLWLKNTDAVHINDDKNIILRVEDKLYLCGNPWSGKHFLDNNITAELKAVIYIERSKDNSICKANEMDSLKRLLGQVIRPNGLYPKENWNSITNKILNIPTFILKCNMDDEACLVAKKEIDKIMK